MNLNPHASQLISVILPFHNAERWIGQALESLQNQGSVQTEVIAIDDGSTDKSASIVQRSTSSGLNVRLLRNERNLGIIASLNRGLDVAQGNFIARMDADDICAPQRLSRQISFLENTGTDLCGSWFVEFGQGPSRITRFPHTEPTLRAAMLFQNTICHPTVMARRKIFDRYRYREEYRLVEDYDLFGRVLADFRCANIPEPLLRYRRHPQQATQAKRDAMELVNQRIRLDILKAQGIAASTEEQRLHNLIRAPYSIRNISDLHGIEEWLLKLSAMHSDIDTKKVIASQWIRACIRAAPLGKDMWNTFRKSPLKQASGSRASTFIDLGLLAATKLDYRSTPFEMLRRLGLSA